MIRLFILAFALCAFTAVAGESTQSQDDAILRMLDQLSRQVTSLQQEVSQLRSEVQRIRSSTEPTVAGLGPVDIAIRPDDFTMGNDDASIAIVEFSDFQCSFCLRYFRTTLPPLKEKYIDSGQVKYVFRHFPLAIHKEAKPAAYVAQCAGRQGDFWDVHQRMFEGQRSLGAGFYAKLAADLELDQQAFTECIEDPALRKAVDADVADASRLGVRGTPTFFVGRVEDGRLVGGRRISGAQPYQSFVRAIEALL